MKKQSNPPPPKDIKRPKAPIGPPSRKLLSFNWCTIFGHKMRTVTDNIAGPHQCIRKNCDHTEPAVEWPTPDKHSWNPEPPSPPMAILQEGERETLFDKCDKASSLRKSVERVNNNGRYGARGDMTVESTGIHVREKNGMYYVYNGVAFLGALNLIPPQASDDCCRGFLEGTIHQCGCDACMSNKWTPIDQHDTIGWCWIKYKGRVRHAWYKGEGWFMFSEHGMTGCYMTECISGVIAIEVPTL